jgi:isoamylase
LPPKKYGSYWIRVLDTYRNDIDENGKEYKSEEKISVHGRSVILLKHPQEPTA